MLCDNGAQVAIALDQAQGTVIVTILNPEISTILCTAHLACSMHVNIFEFLPTSLF